MKASGWLQSTVTKTDVLCVVVECKGRHIFIVECGIARLLCAMCVFDIWASSSSPGYLRANFVSFAASIAELAHGEKSRTQSLTQSPNLFDAPRTKAFISEFRHEKVVGLQANVYRKQTTCNLQIMSGCKKSRQNAENRSQ